MGPQSCATPVDAGHLGSGSWATGCVLTRTWALCRYRHKAHLLRDLKDIYDFEPARQGWASAMADLLVQANGPATRAREAGKDRLDPDVLAGLLDRYRALAGDGLQDNQRRHTRAARDARRVARRFRDYEDLILRFVTDLAVTEFTNNEAERSVRPVKVQQRSSGGCWRTLDGLAEFAIVQSYLSTAAKWGIDAPGALRQLFTTGPWLPPALTPDAATKAAYPPRAGPAQVTGQSRHRLMR